MLYAIRCPKMIVLPLGETAVDIRWLIPANLITCAPVLGDAVA